MVYVVVVETLRYVVAHRMFAIIETRNSNACFLQYLNEKKRKSLQVHKETIFLRLFSVFFVCLFATFRNEEAVWQQQYKHHHHHYRHQLIRNSQCVSNTKLNDKLWKAIKKRMKKPRMKNEY